MKVLFRTMLISAGLYRLDKRFKKLLGLSKYRMNFPPYGENAQKRILAAIDVVRYGSIALAIHRLQTEKVPGAFAEVGVYQGELSRFIATLAPERKLHLFDTFSGFPPQDLESGKRIDDRFTDTSVSQVKQAIGDNENVVFHAGYFPSTAAPIHHETFAFVMLDVDKYQPTLAGLEVFYPRMNRGGYIFIHDYNSPESEYGVSRAVTEFLQDKPEKLVELPDPGGSVVIRKS